jgi:glycerol kinase
MNDVLSFYREKNDDAVLSIFNFSDKSLPTSVDTKYYYGQYRELFTGKIFNINSEKTVINLKPLEYLVLVKN